MAKADDELMQHAREQFSLCVDAMEHNHTTGKEDLTFSRLGDHWPAKIRKQRERDRKPCLSIPKLPAFMRQVVNDARQNKPSIKVHPVDSGADPDTAEIINGLIRNVEYTSNADIAYDTGMGCAVGNGFGYWRIVSDYAYDDSFEMDLAIRRIANPFSVFGDPNSTEADSSDWDVAFITDRLSKQQFEYQYKDAAQTDWNDVEAWGGTDWRDGEDVIVAEWWSREKIDKPVVLLSDGSVRAKEDLETDPILSVLLAAGQLQVTQERVTKSCKVTQRIMSGAEVLKTTDWPGRYIPIVPIYGDEFDIEGKRYFRSLIHDAIDAQRLYSYMRSAGAEIYALTPKVPFLGPKGAFNSDIDRWNTANTESHPFLEYDVEGVPGAAKPERQMLDTGPAVGAMQEALNANDDIKAIMGIYDASLGQKSNETSGRAIIARQREGDVSTFHFIDNMSRAIRHTGRIIIDLIPHVYSAERVVRVMGEDNKERMVTVNAPYQEKDEKTGQPKTRDVDGVMQPVMAMHDLTVGKYDLVVAAGPSYTTRREEARVEMTEFIRSYPDATPIVGDLLMKAMDWPGSETMAERFERMVPAQAKGDDEQPPIPPEVQMMMEQGKQQIDELTAENQKLKAGEETAQAKIMVDAKAKKAQIDSNEQISREEIASKERIAREQIMSQQRLQTLKDGGVETQDEKGETVVKSKVDVANEAQMAALQGIAQLIVQQGQGMMDGLKQIAEIQAAPSELVVDPATGRKQARKVMTVN